MAERCELLDSCPLKRTIDVISRKWALLIINALGYHQRMRFNELEVALIDIGPKALSDTLKGLEAEGLVKREAFVEIPPRVEYLLTKDGSEFRETVIIPLLKWVAARNGRSDRDYPVCQRIPAPIWMYSSADE